MLTRTATPLIFTALLKSPHCRTFAFLNIGCAKTIPRLDASTPPATSFSRRPSERFLTSDSSSSAPSLPPSSFVMARKRTWGKKKDERARSFAKRGRVGGWGDYSEATPKDEEREKRGASGLGKSTLPSYYSYILALCCTVLVYGRPPQAETSVKSMYIPLLLSCLSVLLSVCCCTRRCDCVASLQTRKCVCC